MRRRKFNCCRAGLTRVIVTGMRGLEFSDRKKITPQQIISGYAQGYFPMARGRFGEIDWFIADPRTIIPLDDRFHVRRSLRRTMRKINHEIRFDADFASVIRACARHDQISWDEVWLSDEMIELYLELHRLGYAHSVEVWIEDRLVGGLYGIALRGAFFGESMFSRAPSASQIALVALVERLRQRGYQLLDAQMRTQHIGYFGAIDITTDHYMALLSGALRIDRSFV